MFLTLRDHRGAHFHECGGGSGEIRETLYEGLARQRDSWFPIRHEPAPVNLARRRHSDSVTTFRETIKVHRTGVRDAPLGALQ